MVQLTKKDVLELAKLAKIGLTDQEVDSLQTDLGNILEFVEKLNDLDTKDLEPTYQVTGLTNVMRKDVVTSYGIDNQKILDNVPKTQGNLIKVNKVL